ncbi:acyl-CoA dehydrogenase family protein [Micromonospora sp. AKA38]|uniref:acyl-CoA dehydrogenase family protein n=1 Tax=Micromonospora sp. AKA38 TaxID=2733861 RepID=UPI0022C092C4|nr:acyl-CoA dehydrogenase family protein [Micromonospora sp. AKA38]GHJ16146.1 acyl-CoA dehydrogenase [Micromonospora sp. AKA38]
MSDTLMNYDYLWPDVSALLPTGTLDGIASRAAKSDDDGELNLDSLAALRECGWPGLAVPVEMEGRGAGLVECCATQRLLGSADPGLAIAVNMHVFSVGIMVEEWRRNADTSWFLLEAIASQGRLVASAFAEPGLAGSVSRAGMTAVRRADGWTVNGRKTPCSLAGVADLYCTQAQSADGDLVIGLLPGHAPGITVDRTWDAMGMRASGSHTVVFDDVHLPKDLVFTEGRAGVEDVTIDAGLVWFCLTATAVYLGVAKAAADAAGEMLHRSRVVHTGGSRAHLPTYQGVAGGALSRLLTLEASCLALATQMDAGRDATALLPFALALKSEAVDVVTDAVATFGEVCGGQSYGRRAPLSRLWRDAQASRYHPPTRAAVRQYLGRRHLGIGGGLDLSDTPVRAAVQVRDAT